MLLFGDAAFGALLRTKLPVDHAAAPLVAALGSPACGIAGRVPVAGSGRRPDGRHPERPGADGHSHGSTLFGQLFLVRLAALIVMALLLFWRRAKWMVLPAGAALTLPAVTSHAALASPAGFTAIGTILDATHLLTAGFWIGGLVVLVCPVPGASEGRSAAGAVAVLGLGDDCGIAAGDDRADQLCPGPAGARARLSTLYLAVLGAQARPCVAGDAVAGRVNRFQMMPN